jgi:hypothetical protein
MRDLNDGEWGLQAMARVATTMATTSSPSRWTGRVPRGPQHRARLTGCTTLPAPGAGETFPVQGPAVRVQSNVGDRFVEPQTKLLESKPAAANALTCVRCSCAAVWSGVNCDEPAASGSAGEAEVRPFQGNFILNQAHLARLVELKVRGNVLSRARVTSSSTRRTWPGSSSSRYAATSSPVPG